MSSEHAADVYQNSPKDWARWTRDDDIGRANLLDARAVLDASRCIRTGKRFSLALRLTFDEQTPCFPGREKARHTMLQHEEAYAQGLVGPLAAGYQFTDDRVEMSCHAGTHMDALGHAYANHTIWNGYPADSTADGLGRADVAALGVRGIVGRAVLLDLPRIHGLDYLPMHYGITVSEIEAALAVQGSELYPADTLILRTGILKHFYEDPERYYGDFAEPGIVYTEDAVDFFVRWDVAGLGTDTLCNEQAYSESLRADYPMHVLLQRNLGVIFHEALWLEDWADDCAADGVYEAFYVAAPLPIGGGSASPMNPIVIK